MNFSFDNDQLMIQDSAESYLQSISTSKTVRAAMATEVGFLPDTWENISQELYWHATHIPEDYSGLGLGYVELAILLEKMGEHLFCAPFFSTVCLGVNCLLVAGTDSQKKHHLNQIVSENKTYTLAYASTGRHWDVNAITASYEKTDTAYILNASYTHVIDGHTSDTLIVAARNNESGGKSGIALFVVPADTKGITRRWLPTMDQTRKQAEVLFDMVELPLDSVMLGEGEALPLLENILSLASIAMAAEQTGVAARSLSMAVEYTKTREQFGRSVASFQAIKHKAADMMLKVEAARSATYYAACIVDEFFASGKLASELHEAASVAKAYCSDAAFFNAGCTLQMHGGVGFTWDYDVHLYFKRAKASQHFFGDSAYHKARIATLILGADK